MTVTKKNIPPYVVTGMPVMSKKLQEQLSSGVSRLKFSPVELLHVRYAENRIAIREITKQIEALTDWKREGGGTHLDGLRDEYLEEGDRWRGWSHAIKCVHGEYDPEGEEEFGLTEDQRKLADLLDQKAALRVEAGKIKRAIFVMGERLIKPRAAQ